LKRIPLQSPQDLQRVLSLRDGNEEMVVKRAGDDIAADAGLT
jgi:hypothetical protein